MHRGRWIQDTVAANLRIPFPNLIARNAGGARYRNALLVLTVLIGGLPALAQLEQQLSSAWVKHILVLRNFYRGQKLGFDANGALISGAAPGFSPADGRVYVKAVQVEAKRLIIRGERPIPVFDPVDGEISWLGLREKIEIEAQLPVDATGARIQTELMDHIFLTPDEVKALDCSPDEERTFREQMLQAKEFVNAKPHTDKPDEGPEQLCFPGGGRAYRGGNGVEPPHVLKSYDPPYPPGELAKGENKSVVLAMIVDASGKPSSMVVVGPAVSIFDVAAIEAVKGWKFRPGSYQGQPVDTAIDVEVNFRVR